MESRLFVIQETPRNKQVLVGNLGFYTSILKIEIWLTPPWSNQIELCYSGIKYITLVAKLECYLILGCVFPVGNFFPLKGPPPKRATSKKWWPIWLFAFSKLTRRRLLQYRSETYFGASWRYQNLSKSFRMTQDSQIYESHKNESIK